MEENDVTLPNRDPGGGFGGLDLSLAEMLTSGKHVLVAGHVQDDAATNQRRHVMHTKFSQAGDLADLGIGQAIIVKTRLAEMAQTIDLTSDADPGLQNVVIVDRRIAKLRQLIPARLTG